MARYDGMEDLLQKVSERMAARNIPAANAGGGPASLTESRPEYADLLEVALLLVRDASQVNDILPEHLQTLTEEQRADLLALFGKVARQMANWKRDLS